jgi:hypothetical protein
MVFSLVRQELSPTNTRYILGNLDYPGCQPFLASQPHQVPKNLKPSLLYFGRVLLTRSLVQVFGIVLAENWQLVIETDWVSSIEIEFVERLELIVRQLVPSWVPQPIPDFMPQEYIRLYNALSVITMSERPTLP